LIATVSWVTEALMFGSLMMLASGVSVFLPSSASASGTRCSGVRFSGKAARMRAATEISLASTVMPVGLVKVLTTGRKAWVASSGASSVRV